MISVKLTLNWYISCPQVQLQSLWRGRGQSSQGCTRKVSVCLAALPFLLQPLHEPHAVTQVWEQAVCLNQGENGGDAAAQHVLDWSTVPEKGCGHLVPVQADAHVHLRLCLLPEEKQPVCDFWGMAAKASMVLEKVSDERYFRITNVTWRALRKHYPNT